jgi:hypothetical protein
MKQIFSFKSFFKPSKNFNQVLINFKKFIDSVCEDEIMVRGVGKFVIANIDLKNIGNKVEIKLIHSQETYIVIELKYNSDKKFDMLTWQDYIMINGTKVNPKIEIINGVPDNLTAGGGTLYTKIREYLIENDLIGQVI